MTPIRADFQELLARAESVGVLCADTVDLILNGAMLRESQKAIQKAYDQRRLTILAYLFLPLSFVSSLFGMNVKELGQGTQGIWLPFVVLVPVGVISWLLFYPNMIQRILTLSKRLAGSYSSDHQTQGATIPLSNSRDKGAVSEPGTTSP